MLGVGGGEPFKNIWHGSNIGTASWHDMSFGEVDLVYDDELAVKNITIPKTSWDQTFFLLMFLFLLDNGNYRVLERL